MGKPQHLHCECGFTLICPWDRYCAGCGISLTGHHGEQVTIPDTVKVGSEQEISFNIFNKSRVPINVVIPHIAPDPQHTPPRWLKYNAATGNQQSFELMPDGYKTVTFEVDQKVIGEMLRAPVPQSQAGPTATVFRLKVMLDADYRRQTHEVIISLLGQADLRPAAIEFPSIWLTNPGSLALPFRIYNASGEDMSITQLQLFTSKRQDEDIVEALFPIKKFTYFTGLSVLAGKHTDISVKSIPIHEALQKLTEHKGTLFQDPHAERRQQHWIEKWPALTRIRFVLEATLKSSRGNPVPTVRSLVVMALLRPPLIRDASPNDELWKMTDSLGNTEGWRHERGVHQVKDNLACTLTADLSNDSAMPVMINRITVERPWVEVISSPIGQILAPEAQFLVRVRLDMSRRDPSELRSGLLSSKISIHTTPPTPLNDLDIITVRTNATAIIPGCIGIDFGTSNCAACYMPAGDPPMAGELSVDPVPLSLESTSSTSARETLSSILVRRLTSDPQKPDPDFAFGADVDVEGVKAPDNVIRGIKRILSQHPTTVYRLRTSDTSRPVIQYKTQEIAARILRHLLFQAQSLAPTSQELRRRLVDAAERRQDLSHPTPEDIREATAFRFTRAVFTHPVDAPESLKQILYESALVTEMANEYGADGTIRQLSYQEFCAQRLVDESTAAITHFVYRNSTMMQGRRPYRMLCIDIGGGTTDISAMIYNPSTRYALAQGAVERRQTLTLCYRKGIHDFAGMDLDRLIVLRLIIPLANQLLTAQGKGKLLDDLIDDVLQGYATEVVLSHIAARLPPQGQGRAADRFHQDLVQTTANLRNQAEELKKQASQLGDSRGTVLLGRQTLVGKPDGTLGTLEEEISLELALSDINALIKATLLPRLSVLDEVVNKTTWGWERLDILMFTGQTSRAPIVRDTIITHIQQQRPSPIPTVVVPQRDTTVLLDSKTRVVEFDPKRCVPSGAALRGHGGRSIGHIHMLAAPTAKVLIEVERRKIMIGDPLPAFLPADSIEIALDRSEVILEIGDTRNSKQQILEVPFPPDTPLTLVLDDTHAMYLVRTSAEATQGCDGLPNALVQAILHVPEQLFKYTGISGPVITWFLPIPQ